MSNIPRPPNNMPQPQLERCNANHYHSEVIDRIVLLTLYQMMSGMLVMPEDVRLVERHVTHKYISGSDSLEFRFIFHVVTREKSHPRSTWLVSISAGDVPEPNGQVVESTTLRRAKLYEWEDEKGWQHVLDFEHPYTRRQHPILERSDLRDPLDWSPSI